MNFAASAHFYFRVKCCTARFASDLTELGQKAASVSLWTHAFVYWQ